MIKQGEPKGTGFSLSKPLSTKPNKLTVRSVEARQSSQVGGGFYSKLKKYAHQMISFPTPTEEKLYRFLSENSIKHHPQKVICPYIVDVFIPEKVLVLELDGEHHYKKIDQMTYDMDRDTLLMSLKLMVIRLKNKDITFYFKSILDWLNKLPNRNIEKLCSRIGKHNKRYEEVGWNKISTPHLKKNFRKNLERKLDVILRTILMGLVLFLLTMEVCMAEPINYAVLAQIESSGNPKAENKRSGARGLFQITTPALTEFNNFNKAAYTSDDLFNPMINQTIAKWYLEKRIPQMLTYYKIPITIENQLHAYNAGIGRVKDGVLPEETINYIMKYRKLTGGK
jgi:very-short-patch-repair endonuclease